MTINQLHKLTAKLIDQGAGRRGVCVSKDTFTHPLESDGATIMDVVKGDLQVFPMMDDDGGFAVTKKGREITSMALVLEGGEVGNALKNGNWIDCTERLPTHFYGVLGFVTGGPLVIAGERGFIDRVSYDPEKKEWHESTGLEDAIVPVSHWMHLPYAPFKPRSKKF